MSIVPHPKQQHLSENAGNINTNELVDDTSTTTLDNTTIQIKDYFLVGLNK